MEQELSSNKRRIEEEQKKGFQVIKGDLRQPETVSSLSEIIVIPSLNNFPQPIIYDSETVRGELRREAREMILLKQRCGI